MATIDTRTEEQSSAETVYDVFRAHSAQTH